MTCFRLLVLLALMLPVCAVQAQHTVSGTVTDADDGTPLPGVNVLIKGTTTGAATGFDGQYSLAAPSPDDTLVFSFVSYETQEVPIEGRTLIDIALAVQVALLEELVVTGYSTQRKADLTGAVSVVELSGIQDDPTTNPVKSLQGKVPGVFIQTDGSPDGRATVRIRGVSTLGNNDPLYIIDGIPAKSGIEAELSPDDIESMQVLKDASSASIYGSRAANGVIIITTKKGTGESINIDYSSDFTFSEWANRYEVLNAEERGRVLWQAAINDGLDPDNLPIFDYDWTRNPDGTATLNRVIIPEFLDPPVNNTRSTDNNWPDLISRTGFTQSHSLNARFGSQRGGALLGFRYHDNQAILRGQEFSRFTARINTSYNFFDGKLRIGENFNFSKERGSPLPSGAGGQPFELAMWAHSILPVHTEDGGWAGPIGAGFDDRDNPIRVIEQNTWDEINSGHAFGNAFAELSLTRDLMLTGRFGIDWERIQTRDIQRRYVSGFLRRDINSLRNIDADNFTWTFNGTVNYDVPLGRDHDVKVLAGVEAVSTDVVSNTTFREDFAVESLDFFVESAGSGRQTVSGFRTGFKLLSYFSKLDYNYKDRYLAAFTFRVDGSSRFGQDNRFGTFPAFSFGWRLTEEPFLRDRIGVLNDLKFRLGWGKTGNQEIGDFASFALFEPKFSSNFAIGENKYDPNNGTAYDIRGNDSGGIPGGFRRLQIGNDDLRWEETTELNLGADFSFLDYKFTGSFDYYTRETSDILIQPRFIAVVGDGGLRFVNGATVETKGVEFMLTYENTIGEDFRYSITGNLGSSSDKITDLPPDVIDSFPGNVEQDILGHSQFSHFGFVADGLFRSQAEVDAHANQPGKGIGRIRYRDLNGDGEITSLDQRFLGDSNPDLEYGLTTSADYKGLDVSLFFQGVQGRDVAVGGLKQFTDFTSFWNGANYGRRTLDAFSPQNPDSDIPALTTSDTNNERRFSTYFIEDGSYLKLRQATIGYTLPKSLTEKLQMSRARIYLRGENLLTFEMGEFTGPDPETPDFTFARPRTVTFGVDLSF